MEFNTAKFSRVFFAIWPDEQERCALSSWQQPMQKLCGGRLCPAEKLHNTLLFLGAVEVERLETLQLAAQEVSASGFKISFDIARYWGHNHIVYAAASRVPEKLLQLQMNLSQSMRKHHFKFDHRLYKPHVTLMRHAKWSDSPLPGMPKVQWNVNEFVLVQSHNEGQEMRYEILARFPLNEI